MKDKSTLNSLEQVRAARHRISAHFDHDPRQLVEHYLALQQQYKGRLVESEEEQGSEQAA